MRRLDDFDSALQRFEEALKLPPSDVVRDSAILRFSLLFETAWKACQEAAAGTAGREVRSPREAFGFAFQFGWSSSELVWPEILRDRNSVVHTYNEKLADELFARLTSYVPHFSELNRSLHAIE